MIKTERRAIKLIYKNHENETGHCFRKRTKQKMEEERATKLTSSEGKRHGFTTKLNHGGV